MKKQGLFFLAVFFSLLFSSSTVSAQHFDKGTGVFSAGLGLGDRLSPNYTNMSIPPLFLSYEHAILDKIWLGQIGIGGVFSVSGSNYRDRFFQSSGYNYTFLTLGFRAAYHLNFYELTGQNFFRDFDIYAGLLAGYTITHATSVGGYTGISAMNNKFGPEAFVGARYYFTPSVAAMLEASPIGINFLKIGFSFKF